jgi:hypothetical protein
MTTDASMRMVFRHALQLAVLKDDPEEAASQLVKSAGADRALLDEAHDHYQDLVAKDPADEDARRALVLLQWARAASSAARERVASG